MTFELLAKNIENVQTALQQQAAHAVNLSQLALPDTIRRSATAESEDTAIRRLPTEEEIKAFIAQSIRSAE